MIAIQRLRRLKMKEVNKVSVSYNGRMVGSIVRHQRYLTAFVYDPEYKNYRESKKHEN